MKLKWLWDGEAYVLRSTYTLRGERRAHYLARVSRPILLARWVAKIEGQLCSADFEHLHDAIRVTEDRVVRLMLAPLELSADSGVRL